MNQTPHVQDGPSRNASAASDNAERAAGGRFRKGNPGGPGNPFARRVAALRQVFLDVVTDEELRIVVGQLMVMAKLGDLAAIKLVLQYTLGKPSEAVDPDTLDVQEMELFRRAPDHAALTELIQGRMPTEFACELFRALLPAVGQGQADKMADAVRNGPPEPPPPPKTPWDEFDEAMAADDDPDEEDDDDEGDDAQMEDKKVLPVGQRHDAAPSTNGELTAPPRPRATRPPSPNVGNSHLKPPPSPSSNGDNGRPRPTDNGRGFIPRAPGD